MAQGAKYAIIYNWIMEEVGCFEQGSLHFTERTFSDDRNIETLFVKVL